MVAIVIGGVVALLVYGSARAGLDSSDRIARHRAGLEHQAVMRALIAGALRHPADASAGGEAVFSLDDLAAVDSAGARVPRDRVRFLSRGVVPPFGGSGIWRVTLEAGERGLAFTAEPEQGDTLRRVEATLPAIRGLDALVMSLGERVWATKWSAGVQMPAAVTLHFLGEDGAEAMAPLVVRTDLREMP
jgi:hypothetical protein